MPRHLQTKHPEDTSSRQFVASQQGRVNQHECLLWAILNVVLLITFGHTTACCSPALVFSATIHFALKHSAPSYAVRRHSPSSCWAAVVHSSTLMPKALRSTRKHTIHSASWRPAQPALPIICPNITYFGSLVSYMRAINHPNKIGLLRKVASMLSLHVLRSVST